MLRSRSRANATFHQMYRLSTHDLISPMRQTNAESGLTEAISTVLDMKRGRAEGLDGRHIYRS